MRSTQVLGESFRCKWNMDKHINNICSVIREKQRRTIGETYRKVSSKFHVKIIKAENNDKSNNKNNILEGLTRWIIFSQHPRACAISLQERRHRLINRYLISALLSNQPRVGKAVVYRSDKLFKVKPARCLVKQKNDGYIISRPARPRYLFFRFFCHLVVLGSWCSC